MEDLNCRKCGKKIDKLWLGWELCECGHRHNVESGWHDEIDSDTTLKVIGKDGRD